MQDTSLRALGFVAFCCVLALSKFNGTTTSSPVSPGYQYGAGCLDHGVFFTNILPSSVRISMRARPVGFCRTKFSLAKWLKHGSTCLVIAGHDPPFDITVWMDISRNPGPTNDSNDLIDICFGGQNLVQGGNLHTSSLTRTTSTSNNGPGTRFGIPSLITMRPTVTSDYNRPRSIKSKSADFLCYVKSCAADIFAITETWFTERDSAHRAEVTPPGDMLYDHARSGRSRGGTTLLCSDSISVTEIAAGEKKSFEFSEWIILGRGSRKVRVIFVYRRLQYSSSHPVTVDVFFEEFSAYLESIILSSEPLLITSDFNIHVDVVRDPNRVKFLDLVEAMGLLQHVTTPTRGTHWI